MLWGANSDVHIDQMGGGCVCVCVLGGGAVEVIYTIDM